jgi:uncharacterized protein (TIGR02996 family)
VVIDRVRFEKASSFVELWREPRTLVRAFGAVKGEGHSRVQAFPDDEQVKAAYAQQVTRLEGKGYRAGAFNAQLMEAIAANPADPAPYLVYADWLLDQGDPRGELIMRMHKRERFDDLLEANPVQLEPAWWKEHRVSVSWRLGFVQRVTLAFCMEPGVLRRLSRHPSVALLEELEITDGLAYARRAFEEALVRLPATVRSVRLPRRMKDALPNAIPKVVFA